MRREEERSAEAEADQIRSHFAVANFVEELGDLRRLVDGLVGKHGPRVATRVHPQNALHLVRDEHMRLRARERVFERNAPDRTGHLDWTAGQVRAGQRTRFHSGCTCCTPRYCM